jgi:hypothetical protein
MTVVRCRQTADSVPPDTATAARGVAHVQGFIAQQAKAGLASKAAGGDAASATELSFGDVKSLDGALKHAHKLVAKMSGPFAAQLDVLRGITTGLSSEITVAITGPDAPCTQDCVCSALKEALSRQRNGAARARARSAVALPLPLDLLSLL